MHTLDLIGHRPMDNASAAVVVYNGGRGVTHFGDRQRVYPGGDDDAAVRASPRRGRPPQLD
ncbi:hypothetical protein B2J88_46335 [Rhodococcus sp. SRB_17]|nr:hypothetical protein [Rhodococcus sp. SRB_17]